MNKNAAIEFISQNARPLELAIYKYFFENKSNQAVADELLKFQNADGGFGNALEPDFFNPNSSPIATNDAIITLCHVNALDRNSDIVKGIVKYLESHDSFDEYKKRWLFAIDSNKDYPHAIWWEKNGDGISGFNPSISLAAFLVCYGNRSSLYEEIIKEGFENLENAEEVSGDSLKCFLLAYELLKENEIKDEMTEIYDYIVDCDNIVIASPIYFSQPTGKLLDVCSRFQTYFAAKHFRNQALSIKPKKGAVILVGGGDGNPEDAYKTACTILNHINVTEVYPLVSSFNTNEVPAIEDKNAIKGVSNITSYLNGQSL